MSDPRRLVEGDDLGAALLASALVLDADQARARKAALVGVAASGTTLVALGAATKLLPKSLVAMLLTKSVVVGVAVAVVSGGAVGAIALSRSEPSNAAPPIAATSRHTLRAAGAKAPQAPAERSSAPPEIDLFLDEPSAPPEIDLFLDEPSAPPSALDPQSIAPIMPIAAPNASSAGARAASSASVPKRGEAPADAASPCRLAEEVALLQQARTALVQGQPADALAALDAHAEKCSGGLLGIEAEVLRIEALSRSGNAGAASARARRFIALHPDTPYARRVQALSGKDSTSP